MTYLQLVNRVLRRLREEEVTDFSAQYSQLIADFVAEAHAEVVEAHDWATMDSSAAVPLVASLLEYDIPGTNGETMLRFAENLPTVFYRKDGDSQAFAVPLVSWDKLNHIILQDNSQTGAPQWVAFRTWDDVAQIKVWPAPTSEEENDSIILRLHVPETALDSDTDDTSREILAPWRPVYLGGLFLALNERGEEIGEPGNIAERRYYDSIAAAKEADILASSRTNRYEFFRE